MSPLATRCRIAALLDEDMVGWQKETQASVICRYFIGIVSAFYRYMYGLGISSVFSVFHRCFIGASSVFIGIVVSECYLSIL